MAIHDVVEQPVEQVADAEFREIGVGVPVIHDGADVQPIILTDGDQRPPGNERGEFAGGQLTRIGIQPRAVGGQEEVAPVALHLGPLVLVHGVLHGQRMQPEFVTQNRQVVTVGITQVKPEGDRLVGQVIADLGDRETLTLERSVPVEPRACLAPGRGHGADGGGGHRVGITAVEGLGDEWPATQHATGRAFGARWAGFRCGHRVSPRSPAGAWRIGTPHQTGINHECLAPQRRPGQAAGTRPAGSGCRSIRDKCTSPWLRLGGERRAVQHAFRRTRCNARMVELIPPGSRSRAGETTTATSVRPSGKVHDHLRRSRMTTETAPLAGLRVLEISSFVAAPLGGLTLAQLGAEVIRIDRQAADPRRPLAAGPVRSQPVLDRPEQGQALGYARFPGRREGPEDRGGSRRRVRPRRRDRAHQRRRAGLAGLPRAGPAPRRPDPPADPGAA